jgi:IS605 OrfB family transposase
LLVRHIQLKSETPKTSKTDNVIGVDFGRRDIAVTSTSQSWSGKEIQKTRDKYSRVRASLQKKASQGTRSSRRRARKILKRLSGRERRYQTWLNHNISKAIISEAKQTQSFVSIEDLTGIRERTNQKHRNKTERRRSNSWAFYQLRTFLEYKGISEGVEVITVNPAYTSQSCHCCLHIGVRTEKRFKCSNKVCGWIGDADENGSKMIALLGLSVNQPRGSELLSCSIIQGLPKADTLSVSKRVGAPPPTVAELDRTSQVQSNRYVLALRKVHLATRAFIALWCLPAVSEIIDRFPLFISEGAVRSQMLKHI